MKIYIVRGEPVALARTRITTHNRCWDSQKQVKLAYGIQIQNQHEGSPLFTGPLHIDATFFMPIPLSSRNKNLSGTFHYFRPDIDNLEKFLLDVATGVLFHEDCLIASITCKKVYDEDPRTEFTVRELRDSHLPKPKKEKREKSKETAQNKRENT